MDVHLVGFSTPNFAKSHALLNKSARKHGIKNIINYTSDDIVGTEFYAENKAIFALKKGYGFWLWKPYIILESLKKINAGDILIYADAGVEIIENLSPVIDICQNKEDILLFHSHGSLNRHYCKRDVFTFMDCDAPPYYDEQQIQASFMLLKKTEKNVLFVEEWLNYCKNVHIIDDSPNVNGKENLAGFLRNNADQSVIACLQVKYGIKAYRNPSQQGVPYVAEYPESNYPQLLHHHWGKIDGRFAPPLKRLLLKLGLLKYKS